jgi:hypothetical protein
MQAAIPHANADLAAENACTMRVMPKAHIRPLTPWRVPAGIAEKKFLLDCKKWDTDGEIHQ